MKSPESDQFPKIVKPTHAEFLAAEARAKHLTEQASFSEAMRVIKELEDEVKNMQIAKRFSATKEPDISVMSGIVNPLLQGLPEAEYKRRTLLNDLEKLRSEILTLTGSLENIIMDIEATKQD